MKLLHAIGLVSAAALVVASGVLAACSSDSGSPSPGTDAGTTPDGNTGTPETGGGADAAGAPSCAAYCQTIMQNCTGVNAEYIDNATCLAVCAKFMVGSINDTGGQDTLGCRQYHAGAAAMNADLHCHHAGLMGAGVCSTSNCAGWCEANLAQCTGANPQIYPDQATCVTACMGFPVADGGDNVNANLAGNTLNCRLYHLEAAYMDPALHCPHTAPDSGTCH